MAVPFGTPQSAWVPFHLRHGYSSILLQSKWDGSVVTFIFSSGHKFCSTRSTPHILVHFIPWCWWFAGLSWRKEFYFLVLFGIVFVGRCTLVSTTLMPYKCIVSLKTMLRNYCKTLAKHIQRWDDHITSWNDITERMIDYHLGCCLHTEESYYLLWCTLFGSIVLQQTPPSCIHLLQHVAITSHGVEPCSRPRALSMIRGLVRGLGHLRGNPTYQPSFYIILYLWELKNRGRPHIPSVLAPPF